MNKLLASCKYINWLRDAHHSVVSNDRFLEVYENCKKQGMTQSESKTLYDDFKDCKHYDYFTIGKYSYLRLKLDHPFSTQHPTYLMEYSTNAKDDGKNTRPEHVGSSAIKTFNKLFKQHNETTLAKAYCTSELEVRECIPKQLYYIDKRYVDRVVHNVSGIDASSHYPSCICGRLPTSKGMIRKSGTLAPTFDYPFAFYVKSGHCAEYGVFDTHNWLDEQIHYELFDYTKRDRYYIPPEDDETILMQASDYKLDNIINDLYRFKSDKSLSKIDRESYKLCLNGFIGMLHTQKYSHYKYAHLVAICLGRANQKHIDMMKKIGYNNIIQACVDSIIYLDKDKDPRGCSELDKGLGKYVQEFYKCDFMQHNTNCYVVRDGEHTVKVKHQCYDIDSDGEFIDNLIAKDIDQITFASMKTWKRAKTFDEKKRKIDKED